MNKEIFDYEDYRKYLLNWILEQPGRGRGMRASLAEATRSPTSHISQVLGGKTHFTPEQAEEINEALGHSTSESEYFLLLIQLGRAGSTKLQKRIRSQIDQIRQKRLILKERLDVKSAVTPENQARFYSSWIYAAIHVLLTINEFQTKEAVAKRLSLSTKKVAEILNFMIELGLVHQEGNRFKVGTARVHLGSDSPMISKHHINWRLKAIQSLERESDTQSLHYSSVISISKEDANELKSLLVKSIENAKAIIRESKEEELYSFCLDFFGL